MYARPQQQSKAHGEAMRKPASRTIHMPSAGLPNSVLLSLLGDTDDSTSQPNKTGLSDALKARFERKSGLPLDDVRVHRNSDKPAELGALAYAKGNEIHLGPGQEEHLEHELGHVVQQKQGLVKPTGDIDGAAVNEEEILEEKAMYEGSTTIDRPHSNVNNKPSLQFCRRRNKSKCKDRHPLNRGPVDALPHLHKQAKAEATICKITGKGHKLTLEQSTSKEEVGYSQSYRSYNDLENSETIEEKLTAHGQKLQNVNGIIERLSPDKQETYEPIQIQPVTNMYPLRTWGNCAEPHAVYKIVKPLKDDEYIHDLKIKKAVTADDAGKRGRHDPAQDDRCKNCEQWCSGNKHLLPVNR